MPASGIEEVGHGRGKGTDGGSQEAAQEAREGCSKGRCIGVEKFAVEVAGLFKPDLKRVMAAHGINNQQEVYQLLMNLITADVETQAKMLRCVTTPFVVSEKVSQAFRRESLAELARNSGDEVLAPL
ncbi:hypothetical protein [Pseudomonas ogarae]|uniref:hypothetical protein n=1 Tax=Pseudomonas ogarae (strain DSM 112162 / CECT 30235 / F113) TaxID=1114970 RepID=UPI0039A6D67E